MWAFSDESERGDRMLLGVVFVPSAALDGARAELRKLLLAGQRRIHTSDESPRRRRLLLDTVANLDVTAVVLRRRREAGSKTEARRLLVVAAGAEVLRRGSTVWVLDDVEPVQRARDDEAIQAVFGDRDVLRRPTWDHRPGRSEPLLWAADAVCWAVGAGRDWRRRVSGLAEMRDLP